MGEVRILLTSAGSLLGRGILSTLRGRRDGLFILGGDLDPQSVGCRQCDAAIALPPTFDAGFVDAVTRCVDVHHIDLVIAGRDPDALALAHSDLPLIGSPAPLVTAARDKWLTFQWCSERGIPFVPSVATGTGNTRRETADLVDRWGLPLICKPRDGSGSLGVRVLLTHEQVGACLSKPGMVLQPFLDPPAPLAPDFSEGIPLFWEVPCEAEYGVQALIGPRGQVGPWMPFVSTHRLGRNERLAACDDVSLRRFAEDVIPRMAAAGWRGPVNLQVRRSAAGWLIIEINPRFSGGTSARYLLGFDEVGWTINAWMRRGVVPHVPQDRAREVVWLPQEFAVTVPVPARGLADHDPAHPYTGPHDQHPVLGS